MREWIKGQRTWHMAAADMEGHTMCGMRLTLFGLLYQRGAYPKGRLCRRCERIARRRMDDGIVVSKFLTGTAPA
jgi:hypothetical protein